MLNPNPAQTEKTDLKSDAKTAFVSVYDLAGRIVPTNNTSLFSDQVKIDLSDLEAGTYLVAVTTETGTHVQKLVVRH